MTLKTCTGCLREQSLDQYTRDAKTHDLKAHRCKTCAKAFADSRRETKAAWYQANRERVALMKATEAEREKARRREEVKRRARGVPTKKEAVAAYRAARALKVTTLLEYKTCSSCQKSLPLKAFAKNKQTFNGRCVLCRECAAISKQKWARLNAERVAVYDREYRKQFPEVIRINGRRRRSRTLGAEGDHTVEELNALFNDQEGYCANLYCNADLKTVKKHLDHIRPLARGGRNNIGNLQYLCATCNHQKHAKLPAEWLEAARRKAERKIQETE